MSQLRQEDSATVMSMLQRYCTDHRSTSMMSADTPAEDDQRLPHYTTSALFEPTKLPETMPQFHEDSQCSSEAGAPHCPVCGKSLHWIDGDDMLLNKHVDECLNKVAVSELLATEKQTSSVSK